MMENSEIDLEKGFIKRLTVTWTDIWRRKEQRLLLESLQNELIATKSEVHRDCLCAIIKRLESEIDDGLFI